MSMPRITPISVYPILRICGACYGSDYTKQHGGERCADDERNECLYAAVEQARCREKHGCNAACGRAERLRKYLGGEYVGEAEEENGVGERTHKTGGACGNGRAVERLLETAEGQCGEYADEYSRDEYYCEYKEDIIPRNAGFRAEQGDGKGCGNHEGTDETCDAEKESEQDTALYPEKDGRNNCRNVQQRNFDYADVDITDGGQTEYERDG